jgi:hypothetical protein
MWQYFEYFVQAGSGESMGYGKSGGVVGIKDGGKDGGWVDFQLARDVTIVMQ